VSDVTYDTANADEMQVLISGGLGEAETGGPSINIVPKSGRQPVPRLRVLQHVGRLGDLEQCGRRAAQLRHHAAADAAHELGLELQPGRPIKRDRLWFFANVRAWANAAVLTGSSPTVLPATRRTGTTRPITRSSRARPRRKDLAGRLTAQLTPRNR
jgi:hypothetical protein